MSRSRSDRDQKDDAGGHADDVQTARRRPRTSGTVRVLGRLAFVLIGLVVPLVALELIFRVAGPVLPGDYQTAQIVAVSEAFGRQNMANRSGWKRSSEFSVHVQVNSKGLRGPETPYEKPAGVYRILVVGDSFTFGGQVEEEETLTARLEEQLQAALAAQGSAPFKIETINAGVDGWNTANEIAWLRTEGFRYEPDLVLLMFYAGNDPGENYDTLKAVRRLGVETDSSAHLPAREFRQWLADISRLYAYLETGVIAKLAPPPPTDLADLSETAELNVRRSTDPGRREAGWQLSGDLVKQFGDLCEEHGVGVLLVGIPTVEHLFDLTRPPNPFQAIADAAQMPVIDLLMPFRSEPPDVQQALYFPKDHHWTPTGHQVATKYVTGDLVQRGLIPARSAQR
ncbi:MAG: SGNH/GDSL hydrolase family protein [Chloroflexota bacterium]